MSARPKCGPQPPRAAPGAPRQQPRGFPGRRRGRRLRNQASGDAAPGDGRLRGLGRDSRPAAPLRTTRYNHGKVCSGAGDQRASRTKASCTRSIAREPLLGRTDASAGACSRYRRPNSSEAIPCMPGLSAKVHFRCRACAFFSAAMRPQFPPSYSLGRRPGQVQGASFRVAGSCPDAKSQRRELDLPASSSKPAAAGCLAWLARSLRSTADSRRSQTPAPGQAR